jgi:hypothetical protein
MPKSTCSKSPADWVRRIAKLRKKEENNPAKQQSPEWYQSFWAF